MRVDVFGKVVVCAGVLGVALAAWADPEPEVSVYGDIDLGEVETFASLTKVEDLRLYQIVVDQTLGDAAGLVARWEEHLAEIEAWEELAQLEELGLEELLDFGFDVTDFFPEQPGQGEDGAPQYDLTDTTGDGWGCDDDPFCAGFPSALSLVSQDDGTSTVTEDPDGGTTVTDTTSDADGNKVHTYVEYGPDGTATGSGQHTERPDGSSHVTMDIYHSDGSVTHVEAEFDKDNRLHGMRTQVTEPGNPKGDGLVRMPLVDDPGGFCPLAVWICREALEALDERPEPRYVAGGGCVDSRDPEEPAPKLDFDEETLVGVQRGELRGNPTPGMMHMQFPVHVLPPRPGSE